MPKAKYLLPKLKSSIKIPGENALNRFRHLLIKVDCIPISAYIVPSASDADEAATKLQELWMSGIEIESVWGEPNIINSYTDYAEAIVNSIYEEVLKESIEETDNLNTKTYSGKFIVFSLGLGQPEQVRVIGPISPEQYRKFKHPRVFQEFVNIITPISHLTPSQGKTPEILGTIEDIEALTSYASPMTFAEFLNDYTSGLLLKIAENSLNSLDSSKCSISEVERANGRVAMMRLKKSLAEGLIELGI